MDTGLTVGLSPVISIGGLLLAGSTDNWSLLGLAHHVAEHLDFGAPGEPLSVRAILLSKAKFFAMDPGDLHSYLESLFLEEHCPWTCSYTGTGGHIQGVARSSIPVSDLL